MRHVLKYLLLASFCTLLAAGGWVGYTAWTFLNTAPETPGKDIYIDIPPGATLSKISITLEEKGAITSSFKFRLLARYKKASKALQAGRFQFSTGWLPEKVLDTLVNGKPVLTRITIPEGLTLWQTAKLLADGGCAPYDELMTVLKDPKFLLHYGIPFATAEGFLMPDTYLLKLPDEAAPDPRQAWKIAGRLVDNFWQKAASCWLNGTKPERKELQRLVILASIVEKETAVPDERPRVAGVYTNRLARNMLLQADPCVIYGLGESFRGNLTKAMLNDPKNAYNTYQRAGLPPGPICSFGVSALKAAVKPEQHDYLYFVAITDGGAHKFSKTLREHNNAVQQYLKNRRKAQSGQ